MDTPRRADQPGFGDADREAWAKLAAHESDQAVADKAGVSSKTIQRWRAMSNVQKEGGRRGRGAVATDGEKRDLAKACQRREPKILARLDRMLASDDDAVALSAIKVLLDRGWGSPYRAEPPAIVVAGDTLAEFVGAIVEADADHQPQG